MGISTLRSHDDKPPPVAVTLFFGNGQISEFPAAVGAEKRGDGFMHVLRYGPQPPALESMAAFFASSVTLAQVYDRIGTLIEVIPGDRSATLEERQWPAFN